MRRALADDARRLAQDHLELTRVALAGGELPCALARVDVVQIDNATLGLRDHLVRHDEHVTVLKRDRTRDERAEIVALLNLGQALDREDRDHASTPETRIPACAL